jgi:hypothetical protein
MRRRFRLGVVESEEEDDPALPGYQPVIGFVHGCPLADRPCPPYYTDVHFCPS